MENIIQRAKDKLFNSSISEPNTGCMLWTGLTDRGGYGKIGFNYKSWRAHRLSFHLFKQNIKNGQFICHKCDTPACINPDHLFIGTPLINMQDKVRKGRLRNQNMGKTHCKHGHEFTPENIRWELTRIGNKRRTCVICYTKQYKNRNLAKALLNKSRSESTR